jgi:hypothetical protein
LICAGLVVYAALQLGGDGRQWLDVLPGGVGSASDELAWETGAWPVGLGLLEPAEETVEAGDEDMVYRDRVHRAGCAALVAMLVADVAPAACPVCTRFASDGDQERPALRAARKASKEEGFAR